MVKVSPLGEEDLHTATRLGFMSGEISVPDDFDEIAAPYVLELFEGKIA